MDFKWARHESLYVRNTLENKSKPVAAFDFDGTLSKYRGKGPEPGAVWIALKIYAETHHIVVISNRSVSKASKDLSAVLKPLEVFFKDSNLPALIIACTGADRNRKPCTGAWEYVENVTSLTVAQKMRSFFVGDAAGRPGDFAASDRWFAHNCGLRFYVPEQIFGDVPMRADLLYDTKHGYDAEMLAVLTPKN